MTTEREAGSLWGYFRGPFPSTAGFSAYRMPGLLVHLPVLAFFLWLGWWLAFGTPRFQPLMLIFLIIGIYIGRDVAILAHYSGLITLAVLGGGFAFLAFVPRPAHLAPLPSVAIIVAITVLFGLYVKWFTGPSRDR